MQQRVITIGLLIGLCFGLALLVSAMSAWNLPDNQQGFSPKQPIDYSHRLHAGDLNIDCKFCHSAAETSRHAGIPSSDVCMKCHKYVTTSYEVSQEEFKIADEIKKLEGQIEGLSGDQIPAETKQALKDLQDRADALENPSSQLQKLYDSLGLDEKLEPKPDANPQSIPWVRVHNLPDYVTFNHQAHVSAGVSCQKCHGPVESMERMRQESTLSMGWCVNCHREATQDGVNGHQVHASTDCTVCHH